MEETDICTYQGQLSSKEKSLTTFFSGYVVAHLIARQTVEASVGRQGELCSTLKLLDRRVGTSVDGAPDSRLQALIQHLRKCRQGTLSNTVNILLLRPKSIFVLFDPLVLSC